MGVGAEVLFRKDWCAPPSSSSVSEISSGVPDPGGGVGVEVDDPGIAWKAVRQNLFSKQLEAH